MKHVIMSTLFVIALVVPAVAQDAKVDGAWTLTNRTRDGEMQTFTDLVFHGGPGSTLEMRLFSREALEREFKDAGFARIRIAAEPYLPFGIHWPEPWSVPMVAYA